MNKKKMLTYILLTYGISWLIWLPNVLSKQFNVPWGHSNLLHILGGLGPFLGAVIATYVFDNSEGLKNFFRQKYSFPSLKWLFIGIGTPVLFALIAYFLLGIFTGNWINLSDIGLNSKIPTENPIIVWIIWIVFYGFGEKSGWRGLLLPELSRKNNTLASAIVVSIVWATWHLPVFFYDKDFMALGIGGTIGWVIGLMFGSVLLSWLAKHSKWILWPVILWHGTFNLFTASDGIDSVFPALVSTLVMINVIWIVVKYGKTLGDVNK